MVGMPAFHHTHSQFVQQHVASAHPVNDLTFGVGVGGVNPGYACHWYLSEYQQRFGLGRPRLPHLCLQITSDMIHALPICHILDTIILCTQTNMLSWVLRSLATCGWSCKGQVRVLLRWWMLRMTQRLLISKHLCAMHDEQIDHQCGLAL